MWIVKTGTDGRPLIENGQPVMVEVPDPPTAEQVQQQIREAATAAATATRTELENAQRQREQELEAQMRQREEAARLAALPEAEQTRERLRMLEQRDQERAREMAEQSRLHGQQIRQLGLVAYRERAVRDVPAAVMNLVGGASEEEIDASVDMAVAAHRDIAAEVEARLREEYERGVLTAQPEQQQQPLVVVPAQPRSPHVVAQPDPQGGYPTPNNAPNPPPTQDDQQASPFENMTTEEAVRSGRYGGEMRAKALAAVRGVQYRGQLGAAPRHWSQPQPTQVVPHQQGPGGVQQPTGLPTPPIQQPQYPQQPTHQHQPQQLTYAAPPAPPAPPPAPAPNDARTAAQEAAARVRAGGGHPEVQAGVRSAVAHTQKHLSSPAGQRHTSPQQAFSGRFAPSPPIQPGAS